MTISKDTPHATAVSNSKLIVINLDHHDKLKEHVKHLKIPSKIRKHGEAKECKSCNAKLLKLEYFLSTGKFNIGNIVSVNIPSYVNNVFELTNFIKYAQKHHYIRDEIRKHGLLKELPTFTESKSHVFPNYAAFQDSDFKKYLVQHGLTGSICTPTLS